MTSVSFSRHGELRLFLFFFFSFTGDDILEMRRLRWLLCYVECRGPRGLIEMRCPLLSVVLAIRFGPRLLVCLLSRLGCCPVSLRLSLHSGIRFRRGAVFRRVCGYSQRNLTPLSHFQHELDRVLFGGTTLYETLKFVVRTALLFSIIAFITNERYLNFPLL